MSRWSQCLHLQAHAGTDRLSGRVRHTPGLCAATNRWLPRGPYALSVAYAELDMGRQGKREGQPGVGKRERKRCLGGSDSKLVDSASGRV